MPKNKRITKKVTAPADGTLAFDGVYLLKMVLYLLLGSIWIKASNGDTVTIGVPVGLIAGLVFTLHEHFQLDRKIEYAVLLAAMLFGYFAPYGLYVNF